MIEQLNKKLNTKPRIDISEKFQLNNHMYNQIFNKGKDESEQMSVALSKYIINPNISSQ